MEPIIITRRSCWVAAALVLLSTLVSGNLVFPVSHRLNGREGGSLREFKAHDDRRHARFLASSDAVDIQLGGNGHPSQVGLYFTKLGIGNPSKDYYVQVDTGSDLFWVSSIECGGDCPEKSEIESVKLTKYDQKSSSSSKVVNCDDVFCTSIYNPSPKPRDEPSTCQISKECRYSVTYGDGSSSAGYFVRDDVHLQKASGDSQTSSTSGSIVFGAGVKQNGALDKTQLALSGIIGFGQANSSILSQLAYAGKVRRQFAHCLDNTKRGGGIWALGEVVEPKIKNHVPIVPNQMHYNAKLESIQVGSDVVLQDSNSFIDSLFGSDKNMATFDSGTTLCYLPTDLQEKVAKKILDKQPGLKLHIVDKEFICFNFENDLDEKFPVVKFTFKNGASISAYPRDYLFSLKEGAYCLGWMKSRSEATADIILGDMILSNKIVVYDLEKQMIGWADHNCSTSIKMKGDESGSDYSIAYHQLQGDNSSAIAASIPRLLLSIVLLATAAIAML